MLDTHKAQTKLGWQPLLSLREAVEWTVDWYRASNERKDMVATTQQQLEQFMERVKS